MRLTYTIIFVSFVLAGLVYGRLRVLGHSSAKSIGTSMILIAIGSVLGVISFNLL